MPPPTNWQAEALKNAVLSRKIDPNVADILIGSGLLSAGNAPGIQPVSPTDAKFRTTIQGLDTIEVINKLTGQTELITASEFNPDIHTRVDAEQSSPFVGTGKRFPTIPTTGAGLMQLGGAGMPATPVSSVNTTMPAGLNATEADILRTEAAIEAATFPDQNLFDPNTVNVETPISPVDNTGVVDGADDAELLTAAIEKELGNMPPNYWGGQYDPYASYEGTQYPGFGTIPGEWYETYDTEAPLYGPFARQYGFLGKEALNPYQRWAQSQYTPLAASYQIQRAMAGPGGLLGTEGGYGVGALPPNLDWQQYLQTHAPTPGGQPAIRAGGTGMPVPLTGALAPTMPQAQTYAEAAATPYGVGATPGREQALRTLASLYAMTPEQRATAGQGEGTLEFGTAGARNIDDLQQLIRQGLRGQLGATGSDWLANQLPDLVNQWRAGEPTLYQTQAGAEPTTFLDYIRNKYGLGRYIPTAGVNPIGFASV